MYKLIKNSLPVLLLICIIVHQILQFYKDFELIWSVYCNILKNLLYGEF